MDCVLAAAPFLCHAGVFDNPRAIAEDGVLDTDERLLEVVVIVITLAEPFVLPQAEVDELFFEQRAGGLVGENLERLAVEFVMHVVSP